jgi:hypothetical protein
MTMPVNERIKRGWLPNGYEIVPEDIGETLDLLYFGKVQRSDVGRKVYVRDGQTYIESRDQVIKRRENTTNDKILLSSM